MIIEQVETEIGRRFKVSEIDGTNKDVYFHYLPESNRVSNDFIHKAIERKIEKARANKDFPFN